MQLKAGDNRLYGPASKPPAAIPYGMGAVGPDHRAGRHRAYNPLERRPEIRLGGGHGGRRGLSPLPATAVLHEAEAGGPN